MLKELGLSAWAVALGADRQDARPRHPTHRLRAQLEPHAGRRLGARGARHVQRAVRVLRGSKAEGRQSPLEVRRHHLSARRRLGAVAGERHRDDGQCTASVQEDGRHAESRLRRSERRYPRRHGAAGPARAREVRAGGRHAHHRGIDGDDLSRIRHHQRRDRRRAGTSLRARVDSARARSPTRRARWSTATTRPISRSTSTRRRC